MESTKEQINDFIAKCEELKECKFIMATTKIKDLLKAIVNSRELYNLFETVTKNFDYISARSDCLVTTGEGILSKSYLVLPQTIGQRLAFIFCLLVEFDNDTLNFNEFLRVYFPEEGSYYSSYRAFCKTVIDSLEDMIKQVFQEELSAPAAPSAEDGEQMPEIQSNSARAGLLSSVSLTLAQEKKFLFENPNVPKDEREAAYKILNQLERAVKAGDIALIDALLCGYNYFVLYMKCVSDNIAPLIQIIAAYEETL